ncbi:hypothetical protein AB2B41_10405 [Marimonas sp. MJW-29]|uniref:Uncharacterized protein n=1 Tax=Sulfitobacter sediminis TaxID=3234186 RepID=A0ABV3RLZ3_9RHOB
MKKIGPKVYESLSPRQRAVAYIEALARQDVPEQQRLLRTCPKVTVVLIDPRFTDIVERVMAMAVAKEADLRDCMIEWLLAIRIDPKSARGSLQRFSNVERAWKLVLDSIGIDEQVMAIAGPPPSPYFESFERLLPEPDETSAMALSKELAICLKAKPSAS